MLFIPALMVAVAFLLGLLVQRRRGWLAFAGVGVMVVLWILVWVGGGFDDDPEGTAPFLALVYVVPLYSALWALAVGVGCVVRALLGRRRPDIPNPS